MEKAILLVVSHHPIYLHKRMNLSSKEMRYDLQPAVRQEWMVHIMFSQVYLPTSD